MNTFLDVYSSPVVRIFFSNKVKRSCPITFNHKANNTITVNKLSTNLEINYNNSFRSYSTTINNNVVVVTMKGDIGQECQIDYTVNYSFTRVDLPKATKLKITKWLLAVWKLESANFSSFIACPAGNLDSNGQQWRTTTYSKLGFEVIDSKSMKYTNN